MDLYVGPLPQDVNQLRFKSYFKGFEKHMQIEFRHMRFENKIVSFAMITVNSRRIGKKLIDKFTGQVICGIPVDVREFVHRCTGNERRSLKWRNQPWKFFNRRESQRRKFQYVLEMENTWIKQKQQKKSAQG
jgi:hypothetical protein